MNIKNDANSVVYKVMLCIKGFILKTVQLMILILRQRNNSIKTCLEVFSFQKNVVSKAHNLITYINN